MALLKECCLIWVLTALVLASCAHGEPVDRDALCALTDCEITAGAAGEVGE